MASSSSSGTMKFITFILLASHMMLAVLANQSNANSGGWFGNLIGGNNKNGEVEINNSNNGNGNPLSPPPSSFGGGSQKSNQPPPPPMQQEEQKAGSQGDDEDEKDFSKQQQQQQPPPPPGFGFDSIQNQPPMPPPPQQQQGYDDWHMHQMHVTQQQYHQTNQQQHQTEETIHSLQSDIDSLLSHQTHLYNTIQNLTTTKQDNEQLINFQVNQIDILLEQVADAESYARSESNAALEYKRNCTDLGEIIESLQYNLKELELTCKNFEKNEKCHVEEIGKLKDKMKSKERELEKMACGIEMARLEEQKEKYKVKLDEKKRKKKNRGFISWLFDCMFSTSGSRIDEHDTDEELEKLRDLARSTLLHALQTERNNVHELEAVLSTTQQNNSAISEMVSSRDSLIDELNDRVSVFEEDKMVLKAALKQLQKEMKEEAPRTQKLIQDLESAKDEIGDLDDIIEELKSNHTEEILALEEIIEEKNDMINETESKMSMISVYVDQLEERLASFAVARRDINVREEACKKIEEEQKQISANCKKLEQENKDLVTARDEMKALVDLMIEERSKLQDERDQLQKERDETALKTDSLRDELRVLNENFCTLDAEKKEALSSLDKAAAEITKKDTDLDLLRQIKDDSNSKLEEQMESLQKSTLFSMSLQEEVGRLKDEKENLSAKVAELEETVNQIREEAEEKFAQQVLIEADKIAVEKLEKLIADNEAIVRKEDSATLQYDEEDIAESELHSVSDDSELVTTFIAEDDIDNKKGGKEEGEEEISNDHNDNATEPDFEKVHAVDDNSDDGDPEILSQTEVVSPSLLSEEDETEEEIEASNSADEQHEDHFQPPPPSQPMATDNNIVTEMSEDSKYTPHPPPPPPLESMEDFYQTESENLGDEDSIDVNVSNEAQDELPSSPQFLTEEDETNLEFSSMNENDTPFSHTLEEDQRFYSEDNMYVYEQHTFNHDEYYGQANVNEDNYKPPPPPPPMDQTGNDTFSEQGITDAKQSQPSYRIDSADQFQHAIHREPFVNEFQGNTDYAYTNINQHQHHHQEEQDEVLPSYDCTEEDEQPKFNDEEDEDAMEDANSDLYEEEEVIEIDDNFECIQPEQPTDRDIESVDEDMDGAPTSTEDTQQVHQYNEGFDDDDFEIISDDEENRPVGYFDDHFDDEEKLCNFTESSDEKDDKEEEEQPVEEGDEPNLPEDFEEGERNNLPEDKESSINRSVKRKVPLRKLRKTFASLTGVHGAFTPSSKQLQKKNA